MPKRHWLRVRNIWGVGISLGIAIFTVAYRWIAGNSRAASQGGLWALIAYLVFQWLYDTESNLAIGAANVRCDGLDVKVMALESANELLRGEAALLREDIATLQRQVAALGAPFVDPDPTPDWGKSQ